MVIPILKWQPSIILISQYEIVPGYNNYVPTQFLKGSIDEIHLIFNCVSSNYKYLCFMKESHVNIIL